MTPAKNKPEHLSLDEVSNVLKQFGLSLASFSEALPKEASSFAKLSDSTFAEIFQFFFGKKMVMKCLPLGKVAMKDLPLFSSLDSVLHEYKAFLALQVLSKLSRYNVPNMHTGFASLTAFQVVTGKYPQILAQAWKEHPFNNTADPEAIYNDTSLHAMITMPYLGAELDKFNLSDDQVQSVIMQVAFSLAKAESLCSFEHRDLHLGNILIRETPLRTLKLYEFPSFKSHGILCSIIDFSLASYNLNQTHNSRNLNDDQWIFEGDASSDPQFQVYRDMRAEVEGDWVRKSPRTNILWISFLIESLASRSKNKTFQKDFLAVANRIRKSYNNVMDAVRGDVLFTLWKN